METAARTAVYDEELGIEAHHFQGLSQPFPNHFHDHYVVGLVERGCSQLVCKGREYDLTGGDILLLNPGDSHACAQDGARGLDYRSLNISGERMRALLEGSGGEKLPFFPAPVLRDQEAACRLGQLHRQIMERSQGFGKEEQLLLLLPMLFQGRGGEAAHGGAECREEVTRACAFMEERCAGRVSLDEICRHVGLSRSALLRAFAAIKGVTPYLYLESVRVERAKALLRQGVAPAEVALQTGFSDQSHFTNCFTRFIGLTPGAYRDIWKEREHGTKG